MKNDADLIAIAERLIRSFYGEESPPSAVRPMHVASKISRRMHELNIKSIDQYLIFLDQHSEEMKSLISILTIHTTRWFREEDHFTIIERELLKEFKSKKVEILSLGCSTGEEVYTLALVCEKLLSTGFIQDYHILGVDIDDLSITQAKQIV